MMKSDKNRNINIDPYIQEMHGMLQDHNISLEDFITPDDMQEWCNQHDILRNELPPVAMVVPWKNENGGYGGKNIIFAKNFSSSSLDSAKSKIGIYVKNAHLISSPELKEKAGKLDDDRKFIFHTLLHEIAHYYWYSRVQEKECDSWAFKQMEKMKII